MAKKPGQKRREQRNRLFAAQRGRCFWCDHWMDRTRPRSANGATFEHLLPKPHPEICRPLGHRSCLPAV